MPATEATGSPVDRCRILLCCVFMSSDIDGTRRDRGEKNKRGGYGINTMVVGRWWNDCELLYKGRGFRCVEGQQGKSQTSTLGEILRESVRNFVRFRYVECQVNIRVISCTVESRSCPCRFMGARSHPYRAVEIAAGTKAAQTRVMGTQQKETHLKLLYKTTYFVRIS